MRVSSSSGRLRQRPVDLSRSSNVSAPFPPFFAPLAPVVPLRDLTMSSTQQQRMTKLLCGSSFWRRWSHSRRAHSATAFWQRWRRLGGSRSAEKEKADAEGEPEMDADGEGEGEAEEDGGSIASGSTRPALPAVSAGQTGGHLCNRRVASARVRAELSEWGGWSGL